MSSTSPVTITAHLYVNDSDYHDDMYLNISFTNDTLSLQGGSALDAWNSAWNTGSTGGFASIKIPLVSGDNTVSTTTTNFISDGRVSASWSVQSPTFWSSLWLIGDLFSGSTLIATSTTFIVGAKTFTDVAMDSMGEGLANAILFGTTTNIIGSNFDEKSCLPLSDYFNMGGCLKGLIIPSPLSLNTMFTQAKEGFNFHPIS